MRFLPLLLAIAATTITIGCQSGPGNNCTPCEAIPAATATAAPFGEATAAAAKGGQEASNQPQQQDPARINPNTMASSGSGAATWTKQDSETRSQAGAPSVNQGLLLPTSADARAGGGGGVSPLLASLQRQQDVLLSLLEKEYGNPMADPVRRVELQKSLDSLNALMAQAQASSNGLTTINNTYNLQNSRNVQTVANGSNSGDGQTAIDPAVAREIAGPTAETAKAALNGPATPESPESPEPVAPPVSPSNP